MVFLSEQLSEVHLQLLWAVFQCLDSVEVSLSVDGLFDLIGPAEEQRLTIVAQRVKNDAKTPGVGLARVLAEVVDLRGGVALRSHVRAHVHISVVNLSAGAEVTKLDPDFSVLVRHDEDIAELHVPVVDLPLVAMAQRKRQLCEDAFDLGVGENLAFRVAGFLVIEVLLKVAHCANLHLS